MRFCFVHAADLHIDSPLASLGVKDPAVAARFARANRAAVEGLVGETIASEAAFLIIAGDIFDGDWKDVSTGLFFARALGELHRAGVPTFIVKGNHDAESVMSRSLTYPDTTFVFPANKAETKTLEALRVALLALTLYLQIGEPLLIELAAVDLLLDGLQVVLQLQEFVLSWLVFGFELGRRLLEVVGIEHRLLNVDDRHLQLGGCHSGERRKSETQQTCANCQGTKHNRGTPQGWKTQVSTLKYGSRRVWEVRRAASFSAYKYVQLLRLAGSSMSRPPLLSLSAGTVWLRRLK